MAMGALECFHGDVQHDAHTGGGMLALEKVRQRWGGDARQDTCRLLDHHHINAEYAGGGSGFQPDVAGADDDEARPRTQRCFQAVRVGDRSQGDNAAKVVARQRQRSCVCAWREYQMVVGNPIVGCKVY